MAAAQTQPKKPAVAPSAPQQPAPVPSSQPSKPVMQKLPESKLKTIVLPVVVGIFVVAAGITTGWYTAGPQAASDSSPSSSSVAVKQSDDNTEVGIESEDADTAEGLLVEGGIDGEGTHHLDRDLGPEKYVYLTSTVINLANFEGKKVQVWGDTMAGQKAGWLMDVTKVKVLE